MRGTVTNISNDDIIMIQEVLTNAWAESTRTTYGSGLFNYHVFCDSRSIPEHERAPASPLLIETFISNLAGLYAASTITNYLSGIRAWHILHKVEWKMDKQTLDTLVRAASTMAPPSSSRKKRPPLTISTIETIHPFFNLEKPLDAAVYACLTTTFWCTARLGEFVVPRIKDFDAKKAICRENIETVTDGQGLAQTVFHLPWTKTAPTGEDVYWARQEGLSDPESALKNHFRVNKDPPQHSPLFAYKYNKPPGSWRALSKKHFIGRLNKAAEDAKLKEYIQGHSIRIGSVLEYLLRGLSLEVVKTKGRWKSDAFHIYLRDHAQFMAPYMQANPAVHESFVRVALPAVRR